MMYNNNFVVVIKCNNKVLREHNNCVRLPFGSQYSVLLKNLDSRKAVASVNVDGDSVCDGDRIIVPPNSSVELKGKMRGGRVSHKFKFIERTKEISNHRGNRADDGLVRVEYWFERQQREPTWYYDSYPIKPIKCGGQFDSPWDSGTSSDVTVGASGGFSSGTVYSNFSDSSNVTRRSFSPTVSETTKMKSSKIAPKTDVGITVQGSKTKQDFITGYTRTLESHSTVIVIHLKGKTKQGRKLHKEVTTRTKFRCPTCGRKSKSYAKWCHNCGTNLE